MRIPFVIDNQQHRLADALNDLLAQSAGKPLDIATAYFAISGYRVVRQGLHQIGAFRLLLGAASAHRGRFWSATQRRGSEDVPPGRPRS
jgi:hypothetical protein